jgi:2-keto-4-pentenoate hydratase/2-oxohepta-3-ene-1,7-dioic acid hydratase in catechol pathway
MRLARVDIDGARDWVVIEGDDVRALEGSRWTSLRAGARIAALGDVRLLAAVEPTSRIIGIGLNFTPEYKEQWDGPGMFLRPHTSLVAPGDPITYPAIASRVVFEGELAVMLHTGGRRIPEGEALSHVLGYTCANDVTVPTFTTRDSPIFGINHKGKYFDGTLSVGPWVETEVDDDRRITLRIDGAVRQDSPARTMTWSVAQCISWVSKVMTLMPGDLIMTSSPPGVDDLRVGDEVEVEIDGIGVLRNHCIADPG